MGYRSQVRCLIYGPPDKINAMVVKHQLEGGQLFESFFKDSISRYRAKRSIYDAEASRLTEPNGVSRAVWREEEVEVIDLSGDDWKWYDGYEDVQAWEEFMRSAADWDCSYEFIRIGEEPGDVEDDTNIVDDGEHWLYTEASIGCNVEGYEVPEGDG